MSTDLMNKVDRLPSSPGVYLFLNEKGKPLYVGKAKSLRHRVRSYFQTSSHQTPRNQQMISEISDVEIIMTSSELDALVLEGNLIKKEKPKYNIVLRDDKNFPYLKLTIKESYPRVVLVRKTKKDGNLYFGPYLPAKVARRTLKMIPKFFKVAVCPHKIDGRGRKPCLTYQLDQCLAPCEKKVDREQYLKAVEEVKLFLDGKNKDLIASMKKKMFQASEQENYEAAASYRDTIRTIEALSRKQNIISVGLEDQDFFAHYQEKDKLAIQVFQMRGGSIQSRRQFTFESVDFEKESFYPVILSQYYSDKSQIPNDIYIQESFKESRLTEKMLSDRRGKKVNIIVPSRGRKKDFLQTVKRNARLLFEVRFRKEMRYHEKGLEELEKIIEPPLPLERVEAFDVSHIQGSDTVGSVVVFDDGKPAKKHYRRFKIKTASRSADDYASLSEAVYRRYKRVLAEKMKLPDFILIDGGKGQLSAACSALKRIGMDHLLTGSFEKRGEKLFLSNRSAPVRMEKSSSSLNLIRKIRDEAHRFAISYHRKLRARRTIKSELTDIPGVGKITAEKLLRNFGSVSRLKKASIEDVARISSKKVAQAIMNYFS
jgi:excinuclease ABC subunit C